MGYGMSAIKGQCHKCHESITQADMRISRDGKHVICPKCYEAQKGAPSKRDSASSNPLGDLGITPVPPSSRPSPVARSAATSGSVILGSSQQSPVLYMCQDCSFKFRRAAGIQANKHSCPYCGNLSVKEYVDKYSASNLLREVEHKDFV